MNLLKDSGNCVDKIPFPEPLKSPSVSLFNVDLEKLDLKMIPNFEPVWLNNIYNVNFSKFERNYEGDTVLAAFFEDLSEFFFGINEIYAMNHQITLAENTPLSRVWIEGTTFFINGTPWNFNVHLNKGTKVVQFLEIEIQDEVSFGSSLFECLEGGKVQYSQPLEDTITNEANDQKLVEIPSKIKRRMSKEKDSNRKKRREEEVRGKALPKKDWLSVTAKEKEVFDQSGMFKCTKFQSDVPKNQQIFFYYPDIRGKKVPVCLVLSGKYHMEFNEVEFEKLSDFGHKMMIVDFNEMKNINPIDIVIDKETKGFDIDLYDLKKDPRDTKTHFISLTFQFVLKNGKSKYTKSYPFAQREGQKFIDLMNTEKLPPNFKNARDNIAKEI